LKNGRHAFFSADASVALAIVALIAMVGATALSINSRQADGRVWTAVRVADALANNCAGSGGLAFCDGGYLRANELGDADLRTLSQKYSQKTGFDVSVFAGEATGGVCAHRLYLRQGEVVKGGACVK